MSMKNKNYKFLVYGGGGIGSYFAGALSKNMHNVTLLTRGEHYKKIKTNSINAHLHYSLEKFNEIPMASNMNQIQREFDNSFSRSKNWMFLIGSGYVISGLVSKDEKNKNLEIGLSAIVLTYIINKVFNRT